MIKIFLTFDQIVKCIYQLRKKFHHNLRNIQYLHYWPGW